VFLMGALIFQGLRSPAVTRFLSVPGRPVLLLVMALFGLLALTRMHSTLVPSHIFYAVVLVLFILSLAVRPMRLLVNAFTCHLGVISFSCYLTHFAVLRGVGHQIGGVPFDFLPAGPAATGRFVAVWLTGLAATMLVSTGTHWLVEKPGIKLGSRLIRRLEEADQQ